MVMAYIMYSGNLWHFKYINIDCTTFYQDPQEVCDLQPPLPFKHVLQRQREMFMQLII